MLKLLKLKLLRMAHGKSQWELGRAAEISQGRYSMLERGLIKPTPEERERLAQALHAPAANLFRQACRMKTEAVCSVATGVEESR